MRSNLSNLAYRELRVEIRLKRRSLAKGLIKAKYVQEGRKSSSREGNVKLVA